LDNLFTLKAKLMT